MDSFMKMFYVLIFSYIGIADVACAQTACPGGVAAGSAQCGPSPAAHGVNSAPATPQVRYVPTGKWATTWGAIAVSSHDTGDVGVTVGKFSRTEAKEEAIDRCEATSGNSCELSLLYDNQCAAIAWPSEKGKEVGGVSYITSGPDLKEVSERAVASCVKKRNGGECKVLYSDCTKPVFHKF